MALSALTLSVSSGIQGREFRSAVSGMTAGNLVEVMPGSAPGWGYSNGILSNEGLPYDTNLVVLRERDPVTGTNRTTNLIVTAVGAYAVQQQAASIDASYRGYRAAPVQQPDGSWVWTLYVESAAGATTSATVGNTSVTISGTPGLAVIGAAYSFTPTTFGGSGTKTFSYSGSTLSANGLSFNTSTGAITGTVSGSAGTLSGTITVTDSSGNAPLPISITVAAAIGISGTPGAATVGSAYSFTPSTSGGSGTKTFSFNNVAGLTAVGLSFSTSTGAITGTPTSAATVSGTITVSDATGNAPLSISVTVSAGGGSAGAGSLDFSQSSQSGLLVLLMEDF